LLAQCERQSRGELLQSLFPEVVLGREIGQCSGKPQLVGNDRKLLDLQREIFGGASTHDIIELAQAVQLLDDGLLSITPDGLVLSQERSSKNNQNARKNKGRPNTRTNRRTQHGIKPRKMGKVGTVFAARI